MRKLFGLILLGLLAAAVAFAALYTHRERRFPEVDFLLLNEAETDWYNAGISDYRLVVEVEFSTERRRHEIVVRNFQVSEASLAYWDGEVWSASEQTNLQQAADYSVPGLFQLLRMELNLKLREEVRVDMHFDPVYPRYIYLGTVWQDGEEMEGSEARLTVQEFEVLGEP